MISSPQTLNQIAEKVKNGEDLDREDIIFMYDEADLNMLGKLARSITDGISGRKVSFVSNMILNYTNICNVRCNFCAFYRTGKESDSYILTKEQVIERIRPLYEDVGITQLLIQGGVNPDLDLDYYTKMFDLIHRTYPRLGIHGLSTSEIAFISRKSKMSVSDLLKVLVKSGMESIPGAGAEIFSDEVRKVLGRPLGSGNQWLSIMEEAHKLGIRTSSTMMFGHVEESRHKADHLLSILALQKKYHGFLSFTPWNFEPGNTKLQETAGIRYRVGGMDVLRNIAIARIVFNRDLPVIQSSWLTNGIQMGQMAILFGANDWGGTIYDEKVIPATGKPVGNLRKDIIINSIKQIGMIPVERDNMYRNIAAGD
ncbi:MAG: CofH family radical SAM protein [Thermoplasmataceae archaeon]